MSASKSGRVVRLAPADEGSFLKISGPEDGQGPFELSWNKVSPPMILVLEECLDGLREELVSIIQSEEGGGVDEGDQ